MVARDAESPAPCNVLPSWMFDPEYCRRCQMEAAPTVSFSALESLYDLLVAVPHAARIIRRRRLDQGDRHEKVSPRSAKPVPIQPVRTAAKYIAFVSGCRQRAIAPTRAPTARHRTRTEGARGRNAEGRS